MTNKINYLWNIPWIIHDIHVNVPDKLLIKYSSNYKWHTRKYSSNYKWHTCKYSNNYKWHTSKYSNNYKWHTCKYSNNYKGHTSGRWVFYHVCGCQLGPLTSRVHARQFLFTTARPINIQNPLNSHYYLSCFKAGNYSFLYFKGNSYTCRGDNSDKNCFESRLKRGLLLKDRIGSQKLYANWKEFAPRAIFFLE